MKHNVAVIDDFVVDRPVAVTIGGQQVGIIDILQIRADVGGLDDIVRTEFAIDEYTLDKGIGNEVLVAVCNHAIHISLVFPKVFQDDFVSRVDGQEVRTACHGQHYGCKCCY